MTPAQFQRMIEKLQSDGPRLIARVMQAEATRHAEQVRKHFHAESSEPAGEAWKPLAKSTQMAYVTGRLTYKRGAKSDLATGKTDRRKRGKGAGRVGTDRGARRGPDTILQWPGAGGRKLIRSVQGAPLDDPPGIAIGTNVKYGAYHQDGTKRMPARPFLVFQTALLDQTLDRVFDTLFPERGPGL